MTPALTTDVLIVGSGPAGATAALALATYGVDQLVITKYGWLADTPRAHITNQRTMEVLRDLGVEEDVVAKATPQHLMGDTVFCTSLAGEELGAVRSWGNAPGAPGRPRAGRARRAMCDMPQTSWSRSSSDAASRAAARLRFDTEYLSPTGRRRRDRARARPAARRRRTTSAPST